MTDKGGTIITDVELCTVIGNLMDNAIEAVLLWMIRKRASYAS